MSAEAAAVTIWTFIQEVPIPSDVTELLAEGEQPVAAFTTRRRIVRDWQGITGKKVEIDSLLPWAVLKGA